MTMTMAVSAVYCLMLELFPSLFVGIFLAKGDGALFSYTEKALQLYSLSFLLLGFNVVSAGYFTAVEKPVFSFLISAGRGLVFLAGALAVFVAAFGAVSYTHLITGKLPMYNKTTFDKAGVPVPTSFEELRAAGKAFKEKLGDDYYPLAEEGYERMIWMVMYLQEKYGKESVSYTHLQ